VIYLWPSLVKVLEFIIHPLLGVTRFLQLPCFRRGSLSTLYPTKKISPHTTWNTISIYLLPLELHHVYRRLVGIREVCMYAAHAGHDLGSLHTHVCVSFDRVRLHPTKAH
jgi:hypothetical protein